MGDLTGLIGIFWPVLLVFGVSIVLFIYAIRGRPPYYLKPIFLLAPLILITGFIFPLVGFGLLVLAFYLGYGTVQS